MSLAKLDLLRKVLSIYPSLTISEIVYHEVVTTGLSIGANDAKVVDKLCRNNQIVVFPSKEIKKFSLNMISELHPGELETIKVALQFSAECVLLDNLDARKVAEINIKEKSGNTIVKGTLGILVELYRKKIVSKTEFKECLIDVENRRDIWISSRLCNKLIETLNAGTLD
ncbi:MAG: DUF3368 domain-containing protein [Candidatus Scalindua sp.]